MIINLQEIEMIETLPGVDYVAAVSANSVRVRMRADSNQASSIRIKKTGRNLEVSEITVTEADSIENTIVDTQVRVYEMPEGPFAFFNSIVDFLNN